jgi:hypothetical protein
MAKCTICDARAAKRYCTARGEDICTQCCATEREVTINCPFECSYLRDSRRHEKRQIDEAGMPHRDVRVDGDFMRQADLVVMLMAAFFNKAMEPAPNATDADAREALEALIASQRTGEDVNPEGEVAAGIVARYREKMSAFVQELKERETGPFADRVFLGVLVFMARVAHGYNNGRPKCRAYIHYLRESFPAGPAA